MLKNKDVNLLIMMELDIKSLLNYCSINKYSKKLCENEHFWRNRLWKYYGKMYPREGQTYKEFYKLAYYMNKFKYKKDNNALQKASEKGHLEVIKYLMSLDSKYHIDPRAGNNYAIKSASEKNHLEMVKYLMSLKSKYGIDPSVNDNYIIKMAKNKNYLELVEYLMSLDAKYGIDPNAHF